MYKLQLILDKIDKRILFVFYCLLSVSITYVINKAIISDQYYYEHFSNQLSIERIKDFLIYRQSWDWIGYATKPIFLLGKIFFISLGLLVGAILYNTSIRFKKIFSIVLIAEGAFLLGGIVRLIVLWNSDFESLVSIQSYYPLSIINFQDEIVSLNWQQYILIQINFFHLLYLFLLSLGFKIITKTKLLKSILYVGLPYSIILIIWFSLVAFVAVSLN